MDYTTVSMQPPRRQTLVLVTDQLSCGRIIKAGQTIAGITHTQLRVFHVSRESHAGDPVALQYLYDTAREHGSVLEIVYREDFGAALRETIAEGNTVNVITGEPGDADSVLYELWEEFPQVRFFTTDAEGHLQQADPVRVAD